MQSSFSELSSVPKVFNSMPYHIPFGPISFKSGRLAPQDILYHLFTERKVQAVILRIHSISVNPAIQTLQCYVSLVLRSTHLSRSVMQLILPTYTTSLYVSSALLLQNLSTMQSARIIPYHEVAHIQPRDVEYVLLLHNMFLQKAKLLPGLLFGQTVDIADVRRDVQVQSVTGKVPLHKPVFGGRVPIRVEPGENFR